MNVLNKHLLIVVLSLLFKCLFESLHCLVILLFEEDKRIYNKKIEIAHQPYLMKLLLHFRVFDSPFIRHVSVRLAGHQYALSSP